MSLTDRLAAASKHRAVDPAGAPAAPAPAPAAAAAAGGAAPGTAPVKVAESTEAGRRRAAARGTTSDPYKDLKRVVHGRLVSSLGPTLYDAHLTQSDLEQQVRLAL